MSSPSFGLSLCIQGTHRKIQKYINHSRFIPVYTGNTVYFQQHRCTHPVYPCVYREHNGKTHLIAFPRGLSLCIQGTLLVLAYQAYVHRFIPVYTGNTNAPNKNWIWVAVYPCVYREHCRDFIRFNHKSGLSLCIQGTHCSFLCIS